MTKTTTPPDIYALAAQRLKGKSDYWTVINLESKDSPYGKYIKVQGAVPVGVYKSGPRRGKPKWPHRSQYDVLQFTPEQLKKVSVDWEEETKRCCECGGDGLRFAGWSKTEGNRYCRCSRCGGTGDPPTPPRNTND